MGLNYDTAPGDYTYFETELGKSASGVVKLGAQSERNYKAQLQAGGLEREEGDHGGHLIAYAMGGENMPCNIDAQTGTVNQKDQGNVERNVMKLAKDANNTVAIEVLNYCDFGERPTATMMNIGVRNNSTGTIEEEHVSFQNASHKEQEEWIEECDKWDTYIDPAQEIGISEEERELANSLCGEEDFVDMRLGNCTYREFDVGFLNEEVPEESMESQAVLMEGTVEEGIVVDESISATEDEGGIEDSEDDSNGNDGGLEP